MKGQLRRFWRCGESIPVWPVIAVLTVAIAIGFAIWIFRMKGYL